MATIIEQINELQQAKEAIQDAVVAKGGTVSGDTLAGLADDIMDIPQSADFDWASIGYDEMPEEIRADLEETAAVKAAWDAMPANRKSNIFANNRTLMYFPKDIDLSLLSNATAAFSSMYNLRSIPAGMDYSTVFSGFRLFYYCYALRALPNDFRLPSVTSIGSMFLQCNLLERIPDNFLSHPENVADASGAFQNCSSLLTLPECASEMENVTTIQSLCNTCSKLTEISLTGQYDRLTNAQNAFTGCTNLQKISFPLDMFKNCTTVQSLFQSCEYLWDFPEGKIDFTTATNVSAAFYGCKALRSLWIKIPNATSVANICYNATSITWLRLDDCNTNLNGSGWISHCPLSADGVYNLIDSLADRTGKSALTCTLSATAKANMAPETAALAASKNWTIA